MHSLLARWRVSLRRTRADWPIVAAAWLITLLAATLLAAGPIYAAAASQAGLHQTLADAPAPDTTIGVSMYGRPAEVAGIDGRVQEALRIAVLVTGISLGVRAADADSVKTVKDVPFLAPERGEKLDLYLPAHRATAARSPACALSVSAEVAASVLSCSSARRQASSRVSAGAIAGVVVPAIAITASVTRRARRHGPFPRSPTGSTRPGRGPT